MKFSKIVEVVNGTWSSRSSDPDIDALLLDSRLSTLHSNELFIAIKGVHFDGHEFIPELIKKGVSSFITEQPTTSDLPINVCLVKDCQKALQAIGAYKRKIFDGQVIGITGSNGKTIVKEWLFTVLSTRFNIVKSPKSYNSQIGVPLSLWLLQNSYDAGIIEAGISKPDEMTTLQQMVNPDLGIFTNIGSAHGENFESLEQKVVEKAQLFKNSQRIICSNTQPLVVEVLRKVTKGQIITWGQEADCDYQVSIEGDQIEIYELRNQKRHHFYIKQSRLIYQENICHTIVMALELGITSAEIQLGLNAIQPADLRLSLKKGLKGNYLVDDTYNNDLEGLKLALEFLELQNLQKDRVLILSDLVQSSLSESDIKSLQNLVSSKQIKKLISVGNQLHIALKDLVSDYHHFTTTQELLDSPLLSELSQHLILIKGSRRFKFERVVHLLAEKIHKTRLEIDLNSIIHNFKTHQKMLEPTTKMMVMVKAFGYGSGGVEMAKLLEYQGVDYLGVAYMDEAIELRKSGIEVPIMVMSPTIEDAPTLTKYHIEPEVYGFEQLRSYLKTYQELGETLPCHLILNTGMNRLGFDEESIDPLIEILQAHNNVEVKSIFTHLAAADEIDEDDFTLQQIRQFDSMADQICSALSITPLKHCLNSAGIVRFSQYQMDMVRLGIGLHGLSADDELASQLRFPAQLKSVISQTRKVKKGESIGYGRKGKASKDMTIATVAVGYADGYIRKFGNGNAFMEVNGKQARTIGNVCMDMTMIDITGINVQTEDEVVVFGAYPNINQLAEWVETIPYEILTNVSRRVPRVFHLE